MEMNENTMQSFQEQAKKRLREFDEKVKKPKKEKHDPEDPGAWLRDPVLENDMS